MTVHSGPLGRYLTDGSGRTLYLFAADTSSTSTCNGACTQEWKPFTTSGTPKASGGAKASMVSTSSRGDGTTQVTYAGHPLYFFSGDSGMGDMNGEGLNDFGGKWDAVSPAGKALAPKSSSTGGSSSSSSPPSSEWG